MDMMERKNTAVRYIRKNRLVLIAVLTGILLILLPQTPRQKDIPLEVQEETPTDLEDSLGEILSLIQGAGRVRVLLTEAEGAKTIYQINESNSTGNTRRDTVLVTNANRDETGLIRQILPPKYQGAIILCQGAESAVVRLSIVEAVKSVTGLPADRIAVLKMK